MRRCRAALTALTLALMTLLVAGPAQAGGPTSVLLVVPGSGQTASLYTGDPDYETLARTVGAFSSTGTAGQVDSSAADHTSGAGVTLTWLIHDVTVWRVDRVYLDAKGGPWISTQTDVSGNGSVWDVPPVWHTAVDAKLLAALLHRLGVDGVTTAAEADPAATASSPTEPVVAAVPDVPADDTTGSSERAADTTGSGARVLGWGLGGLALGVALTLAAMRLGWRSRAVPDGPSEDWDLSAERPSDGVEWSSAEELQRR